MKKYKVILIFIIFNITLCSLSSEDIKDKDINKLNAATSKFFEKPSRFPKRYLENDSLIINFSDIYVEKCHINEIEERFLLFESCYKKVNYENEGPEYCYVEDLDLKMLCYRIYAFDKVCGLTATFIFIKKKDDWKLTVVKFKEIDTSN